MGKRKVDAANQQFLAWLKRIKALHPSCTIGETGSNVRGVLAVKPMKAGDLVVEVPDDAVCMAENCCIAEQLEDASLAKATALDPIQEVQGLILAVMAERHAGKASRWYEYLEFIPEDMTHMPMFWNKEELQELRGTATLDKMEGKVQVPADAPTQVQLAWEEVAKPFINKHKSLKAFPQGEAACWKLYLWATAAVASYSFILGDDHFQAMVPFWDALNHITGRSNIRLAHHERRGRGGVLQMIATRDIAVGEEVVNNYGELSQAELLRAYGFVETHPEAETHAHVQVPMRFVVQAAQAEAALLQRQQQDHCQDTGHGQAVRPSGEEAATADAGNEGDGMDSGGLSEFGLGDGTEGGSDDEVVGSRGPGDGGAQAGGAGPAARAAQGLQAKSSGGLEGVAGRQQGAADGGHAARRIRSLGLRLRLCARYGIMPRSGVFKVYSPSFEALPGRTFPPPELTETVRVLLLPLEEVRLLQQRAAAWKPPQPTLQQPPASKEPHTSAQAPPAHSRAAGAGNVVAGGAWASKGGAGYGSSSSSSSSSTQGTVIDPGPVGDELTAAVQAVMRSVAARMQQRYTCGLEEDEQLLARAAAGGEDVGRGGQGEEQPRGKRHRTDEQQQQQTEEQPAAQQELSHKLHAALVARVGEKRCLAALHQWWECGAASGAVDVEQQQQVLQCVRDHVASVWSKPRPGMKGVRGVDGDGDGSGDEEEEEDEGSSDNDGGSSSSSSSSSSTNGEEESGDGEEGTGQQGQDKAGGIGGAAATAGAAANGAQAAATLSRPNLQQKQHFSFDFTL